MTKPPQLLTKAKDQKSRIVLRRGMSLLELTVVVVVLLLFLGMSFLGVRAWKAGSDRAACILNISHAQKAVRSLSNMNGYRAGQTLPFDLEARVFGLDNFMTTRPECPADGEYLTMGNTIPDYGELFLRCTLAESANHRPANQERW